MSSLSLKFFDVNRGRTYLDGSSTLLLTIHVESSSCSQLLKKKIEFAPQVLIPCLGADSLLITIGLKSANGLAVSGCILLSGLVD